MKNACKKTAVIWFWALAACTSPATPIDQRIVPPSGYSLETLKQPVFSAGEVAVEMAVLNDWLNMNYESLTPEQYQGPREHLYYLIDSHVKHLYMREAQILPKEPDLVLQTLFSWSEKLGVYGGSNVFNRVRLPTEPKMPQLLHPPSSIAISLHDDLLRLESKSGFWSFEVPYYFMPSMVRELTATNGMPTQLLLISTGATKHKSDSGHSQATLMFIHSRDVDFSDFEDYWTDQIGIPSQAQESAVGIGRLKVKYYFDATTKIHTEALIWKDGLGAFAMTYAGVDGAYQWNRPHFLDFLRSLHKVQ